MPKFRSVSTRIRTQDPSVTSPVLKPLSHTITISQFRYMSWITSTCLSFAPSHLKHCHNSFRGTLQRALSKKHGTVFLLFSALLLQNLQSEYCVTGTFIWHTTVPLITDCCTPLLNFHHSFPHFHVFEKKSIVLKSSGIQGSLVRQNKTLSAVSNPVSNPGRHQNVEYARMLTMMNQFEKIGFEVMMKCHYSICRLHISGSEF